MPAPVWRCESSEALTIFGRDLADRSACFSAPPEIDPIERQDDVGFAQDFARASRQRVEWRHDMGGMVGREFRARFQIAHHHARPDARPARCARPRLPACAHRDREDHRTFGAEKIAAALIERVLRGTRRCGGRKASEVGPIGAHRASLPATRIEADIDWRGRMRTRELKGPRERFHERIRRGRLVVPFHERTHEGSLIAHSVDPVDPGPALLAGERAGGAQYQAWARDHTRR
jgi:hypothetical protein